MSDDKEKTIFEAVKSGAAKGEEVTDTLLWRVTRRLIKSNWTMAICVIAILFLLWHVVN